MSLIDANAMVNIIDQKQPRSEEFRKYFDTLRKPLITTWPAFTEAMYLLYRIGGWSLERKLWNFIEFGLIRFHFPNDAETHRMIELMEQYRDRPMDLADASLVATAETLGDPGIFTQDTDFFFYRYRNDQNFEVLP